MSVARNSTHYTDKPEANGTLISPPRSISAPLHGYLKLLTAGIELGMSRTEGRALIDCAKPCPNVSVVTPFESIAESNFLLSNSL